MRRAQAPGILIREFKIFVMEWHGNIERELQDRLGSRLASIICVEESFILDRCVIDILRLDQSLHRIHGNYEERGLSMTELIRKNYGEDTDEFINSLLPCFTDI